jgi:hypothetical protein
MEPSPFPVPFWNLDRGSRTSAPFRFLQPLRGADPAQFRVRAQVAYGNFFGLRSLIPRKNARFNKIRKLNMERFSILSGIT